MARFARSISFPLSPSRSFKPRAPSSSYHQRSVSLPCRSHPILAPVAQLHTHIRAVRARAQQGPASASSSVAAGLAHVDALHAVLGDLLDLPAAQAALSGAGASSDRLLDAFLRLADAHGCFQESVVALKQDVAEALIAVRRRDGARLASAVRSQRRAGKELARHAVAARECAVRPSRLSVMGGGGAAEAEVTGLLMESAAATAAASAALFGAVASVASVAAESCSCKRTAALVFPFPAASSSPSSLPVLVPARLVSAVDLHHKGVCIMSRVVETDASSAWFQGSPFRIDALVQEGFSSPSPIAPDELTLSWILIDPATGAALNASSRRPVSVDRSWLSGDALARFTVVLGGGVSLNAAVTCEDRHGHVREVSLCAGDAEGGGVSGRDGLAAVAAARASARQRRGAEEATRQVYVDFAKGKKERKEWKARREGIVDLWCSGVGPAAFLSFLVMLTFR